MEAAEIERLRRLDEAHVWHPYTQMQEYAAQDAPIIVEGNGVRLRDAQGKWYYDGVSSIWLNVHGHRVPEIDAAIQDQLGRVAHSTLLGQSNVPSIELAAVLARLAPKGLSRVFYSDNGSCAVEAALKMALQYWHARGQKGRRRILSMDGGYHGDTLGAVGVAPVPTFHQPFLGLLGQPLQAPYPDCYRDSGEHEGGGCTDAHLAQVERVLSKSAAETAAVIVEPMAQGVGGVRIMPPGFLRGLRDLCDRYDVLLIADEVATGFGRTGRMWACDHEDVRPDLMAVGKGLTGGYLPLAATLATDEVYQRFLGRWEERKTFFHGHSFTGNNLACAAALANLALLEPLMPELTARAQTIAATADRLARLEHVGDARHLGMMLGLDLVVDKATKEPLAWETRAAWIPSRIAREKGLLVRPIGNVGLFLPPIATPQADLKAMLRLLEESYVESDQEWSRLSHKVAA